jgi:VWFA-related protein
MRFRSTAVLFASVVLCAGLTILPVSRPAAAGVHASPQDQAIKVGVSLVSLYATVRDNHKAIVSNLEQNDFKIYEDNVEQKVAFFAKERTLPLTMGLLIDTSGSEAAMIGAEQQAAIQFLQRVMQKKDEALVITFDTDVDMLADWTGDLSELNRAIRRARINAPSSAGRTTAGPLPSSGSGGTNFYDAVYLACHDKMASEAGRKALIILTDADDNGSKTSLQEAVEAAQRADTVIHMLVVYDRSFGFGGGANFAAAKKLAEETGGRSIDVHNSKDLLKAFDEISEELRTEYSLGYYPTNTKLDGTFRKLRVDVTNKDDKALTRKGYYAKTTDDN